MSYVVMSFVATPDERTPETSRVFALATAKKRETGADLLRGEAVEFWEEHQDLGSSITALSRDEIEWPTLLAMRVDVPLDTQVMQVYFVLNELGSGWPLKKDVGIPADSSLPGESPSPN